MSVEYADYAEYYDFDHAITQDIDFYLDLARQCGSPILELACGTGRLLVPLLEAGFEAYLGMPITASDGRVLGHLALFNRKPLGDEVLVERVYRIFLARAAAEIERGQALARLALFQER